MSASALRRAAASEASRRPAKLSARSQGKGKILEGGPVWRAFRAEGWVWQNIDVPDYMHFDTGYPSRPYGVPSTDAR
ncbi:hypothetical protein ACIP6X_22895 [Streptomyces coeruleorubidus]|uniref:hypothetical protein n=1 Tax=Streptomyces coeruleorubidus TaxID=116188 RepID=UPI00380C73E5